jgi:hypothetical protein
LLTEIEEGEAGLAARGGVLKLDQLFVVALRLPGLIVEILDRLVVEQAVDGFVLAAESLSLTTRRMSMRQLLTLTVKMMYESSEITVIRTKPLSYLTKRMPSTSAISTSVGRIE